MASTAVSGGQHGGTIIFAPSTSLNTPGLLPRVTQPASGQSVYVSEIQPAPQMVTNPAYERQSQDGAAVTAPAGPAPRAQETQPSAEAPAPAAADPQAKLTAGMYRCAQLLSKVPVYWLKKGSQQRLTSL